MAIDGLGTASGSGFVTQSAFSAGVGLVPVTPSSIANSGGSASLSGQAVTFSSVTTVSLNGAFTSTFENYRIIVSIYQNATSNTTFRLRTSGSDATAANYDSSNYLYRTGGSGVSGATGNGTGQTSWVPIFTTGASSTYFLADVLRPQVASTTFYFGKGWCTDGTGQFDLTTSGTHQLNTSYDGFTLTATSGNISGTIRVYGYRN